LAAELSWPLFTKDEFKESLADIFEVDSLEWSHRLGSASFVLLFEIARKLLESGVTLIIEGNFEGKRTEADLTELAELGDLLQINCVAPHDVLVERYTDRSTERHPIHVSAKRIEDPNVLATLHPRPPLAIPGEVLEIDTTHPIDDNAATIVTRLSRHT
jgi:predicted kinase